MTTQPRPWTPEGRNAQASALQAKRRFDGLDTVLGVLMILAVIALVLAVIVAFAAEDPVAFLVAGSSLTTVIMCGLGRVVIHMAQTLDLIAADAREVRGISEWRMRQQGNQSGSSAP